jgi:hypothetical protein
MKRRDTLGWLMESRSKKGDGNILAGDLARLDGEQEAAGGDEGFPFTVEGERGRPLLGAVPLQLGALKGEATFEVDPSTMFAMRLRRS